MFTYTKFLEGCVMTVSSILIGIVFIPFHFSIHACTNKNLCVSQKTISSVQYEFITYIVQDELFRLCNLCVLLLI